MEAGSDPRADKYIKYLNKPPLGQEALSVTQQWQTRRREIYNMVKIFRTIDNNVHQINEAQEGSWIALINPTATEIVEIAEKYNIDVE